jgi:spore coat polysaccharide biosynthesis predicted glycosyltransferase SpsG
VAAIRDLGLHALDADLTIDGSLAMTAGARDADLQGPRFAILNPALALLRRQAQVRRPNRVVIALGGGTHVRQLGPHLAAAIRACAPDVEIRIAPGFRAAGRPQLPPKCAWLPSHGLREALADATLAVVAGGVTLYEGCALGTPLVTLAVADTQRVTTSAAAAAGAVIDASDADPRLATRRAASLAAILLDTADVRAALGSTAARLVDGQGTARVVAHLRALLLTHPGGRERHAA